jgi:hypothetical protein
MGDELARRDQDIEAYRDTAPIADDSLIAIAKMAEARIDAVVKIKQLALKVTNSSDWTDQQGKPYLQVSGAEKIANLFNVSWSFLTPEPLYELEPDGHYTYTFQGRFSMGGRSIEVEGSRSSKDSFFKQNKYVNDVKTEKAIDERDNKRDVKMAALTNMLGNGITRLLGIRNLTWEDLEKFAGIKQGDVLGKVEYKKDGVKAPQEKGAVSSKPEAELRAELMSMCEVLGKVNGLKPEEILYSLTVNKEGKYGESDFAAIKFTMPTKGGGEWSPLKAFHSKAKEQFDKATKESAA